ncbi:hypothetical protein CYMTET_4078 [Cymbomonas tetramitiformis]|uniref:Uncharacterized protein n=1 Tax=Cymbomonas tetramitiformis TaxID=36881 RepID=A0AAE0H236_9CHLO|nr:hypothetical protein CYMTET_4078 [Cymbomonas tetramitiformis]
MSATEPDSTDPQVSSILSAGEPGFSFIRHHTSVGSDIDDIEGRARAESNLIIRSKGEVKSKSQVPFFVGVVFWIVFVSLAGAIILKVREDLPFIDALFTSIDAVTATGLATHDITKYDTTSKCLIVLLMQLGSATMLALVPIAIRIRSLRQIVTYGTFNLSNFRRVPEWVVEYKALVILFRVVLLYNLLVYLVYGLAMFLRIIFSQATRELVHETAPGTSILGWIVFHTVSAYCNVGFSLMPNALIPFDDQTFLKFCLCMLILHGNVGFPIVLRWIIILLNHLAPKDSSRKVYFRCGFQVAARLLPGVPNLLPVPPSCSLPSSLSPPSLPDAHQPLHELFVAG